MSGHTKEKWRRDGLTVYALAHDGWRKGVKTFRNRFHVHVQFDRDCTPEEAEANARLIAAAPELLRQIKNLRACLKPWIEAGHRVPGIATLNGADAAIAKAEGREP